MLLLLAACAFEDVGFVTAAPTLDVTPDGIEFGDVRVDTTTLRELNATNPGPLPLLVTARVWGDGFELSELTWALEDGASEVVVVTTTPPHTGEIPGGVIFEADEITVHIPLSVIGSAPSDTGLR